MSFQFNDQLRRKMLNFLKNNSLGGLLDFVMLKLVDNALKIFKTNFMDLEFVLLLF